MRSPTAALLWEIWRRNRIAVAVIVAATVAGRLLDYAEQPTDDPSSLIALLWMVSFLFLFGVFSYTESSGTRGIGSFPRRLFTLPVSSLRLVALPVLTGIASVELLYLLWLGPLSRGGSVSTPFVAVLLGASMVFFQAVFWMLERLGPLRLMIAGAVIIACVRHRSPAILATESAAAVAFGSGYRYRRRRSCGRRISPRMETHHPPAVRRPRTQRLSARAAHRVAAGALPRHRKPFASPAAAQFWFEWRCSGLVLPVLVGGVLVAVVAPLSWFSRADASGSLRLLLGTLATPIMLAIPVGMAFARPTFWSEDLSVPAFVAIRPLTDEQIVAIKMKVAAASVAISWLLVRLFRRRLALPVGERRCGQPARDPVVGIPRTLGLVRLWDRRSDPHRRRGPDLEIPGESPLERTVRKSPAVHGFRDVGCSCRHCRHGVRR